MRGECPIDADALYLFRSMNAVAAIQCYFAPLQWHWLPRACVAALGARAEPALTGILDGYRTFQHSDSLRCIRKLPCIILQMRR